MPKYITIPGFKGGLSEGPHDSLHKQTYQTARDLDVFPLSNVLRPHAKKLTAVTIPTNARLKNSINASDGRFYFIGDDSSTGRKVLYSTNELQSSPTWRLDYEAAFSVDSNELVEFKNRLYFGYSTTIKSFGPLSGTKSTVTVTIASPAVFTSTAHGLVEGDTVIFSTSGALPTGLTALTTYYVIAAGLTANDFQVSATFGGAAVNTSGSQSGTHRIAYFTRVLTTGLTTGLNILKVHSGLGKLFFVHNSSRDIGSYDGTTETTVLSTSLLTIGENDSIVSLEPSGRYVLYGVRGNERSRVDVWDGSATTIVDSMPLHDVGLQGVKAFGSRIVVLCTSIAHSDPRLRIYRGSVGGSFGDPLERTYPGQGVGIDEVSTNILHNAIESYAGKMYFAPMGEDGALNIGVFAYNPSTNHLTVDRINSQGTTNAKYRSLKMYSTKSVITYSDVAGTTWFIDEMGSSDAYSPLGEYESVIFPLNAGLKGKIKKIYINHEPIPADSGFTLQVKHLGDYPWSGSVPSVRTFTVTVASPAVFTLTAHGFAAGDRVRFKTLGLLPPGIQPFKTYYVISTGLSTDNFRVSDTSGGSAVNTTGSQSGTHSLDTYEDIKGPRGNSTTSGLTQSTENATFTEVASEKFVEATHAEIKILYDEVGSGLQPLGIVFPIIIEVE